MNGRRKLDNIVNINLCMSCGEKVGAVPFHGSEKAFLRSIRSIVEKCPVCSKQPRFKFELLKAGL